MNEALLWSCSKVTSGMLHRPSELSLCSSEPATDWEWEGTDAGMVRGLVEAARGLRSAASLKSR
jgi:hypothetical protein